MKRSLCLILVLVMLTAALAGCKPTEQKLLVGQWKGTADLAMAYETLLAGVDADVAGHIDIQEFSVDLTITFREDGTYSWTADEEQLKRGTKNMMDAIAKGLSTYLEIQTGMAMEQLLVVHGKTMDELMAEYFDPDMEQVVRSTLCSEGTYEIDKGELSLANEDGFVIFEGDVTVTKETLELKNGVASELVTHLMPMVFQKVKK